MTEPVREWRRSILSYTGALTDESPKGWTYIIRFLAKENEELVETGMLLDLGPGLAKTRAEALIVGRERAEASGNYDGELMLEEWAYTIQEAQDLIYQQGAGAGPSATMNLEDGSCTECGK